VLLVPSLEEAFGYTMAEGLCAGVPGMAATATGIAEEWPEVFTIVPAEAWGDELADAAQRAASHGRRDSERWQREFGLAAFGARWTEYLLRLARGLWRDGQAGR
jgi:glycosyltransferase involved in cell wall biosynthesis